LYRIKTKRSAERELRRLDPSIVVRIIRAIRALAHEPRPDGCRKMSGAESEYRIRIGDYRVVYSVDDSAEVVDVQRIRHRRDAYR